MTRIFETNNTPGGGEVTEQKLAYFVLEATIIKTAIPPLDEEMVPADASSDLIDGRICVVSRAVPRKANNA